MIEIIFVFISLIFFLITYFFQNKKPNKESLEQLGKEYLNHLLNNISSMSNDQKERKEVKREGSTYINPCTESNYDSTIIPFFTIVYGTQSGTSKKFADSLFNEAIERLKIKCLLKNINEITSIKEFNENALIVFIVSTYGEGGPTDDSIEFNSMITNDNFWSSFNNNSKVNYAIFGLGNSLYTKFNQQGKTLNKIFSANKLHNICDIGVGDDSKNINEAFEEWKKGIFWPKTYDFFIKNKDVYDEFNKQTQLSQINKQDLYEITLSQNDTTEISISLYEHSVNKYHQTIRSKIESLVELRQNNINGSTLKVTFSFEDFNPTYSVGANIGIYPKNSNQNVKKIINHMNYNSDLKIEYKFKSEEAKKQKLNLPIPVNMTIKEALISIIDLSCQITKDLLSKISQYAGDEEQFNKLSQILNDKSQLDDFCSKRYNIIDVITEYDSIQIPFISFCQLMPKIRPRFYTVASSPNKNKEKFDIVIALVDWKNYLGEKRLGLTSNYLNELYLTNPNPEKEYTQITIKSSAFKLPDDIHQPIIMIATGTGIAPFISFLQEMEYRNEPPYETCLIFGTKNKAYDYIYENDLKTFVEKKYLKQLYCAFSRDQEEKIYVQDILLQKFNNKISDLIQKNVKIFICGSLSMGKSVMDYLTKMLDETQVKKMLDTKMIVKELWEN